MQAQAYEGYLENGFFYTAGKRIRLPERKNMFITIPEESGKIFEESSNELGLRLDWLRKLESAIELSSQEDFPLITRSLEMRDWAA
ncbi:MAG: hypothetical protein FWG91_05370 [Lachnospiraceae bacterium]|nr:hypothetical protein [Lachnospiraceae bacterium]